MRKSDPLQRVQLKDFGKYVAECLPKFVEKVQVNGCDELEILISPEGILPVLQFLKDHHNCQFSNLADIAGMDVPSRPYRFEVSVLVLRGKQVSRCSVLAHLQYLVTAIQLENPC